MLNSLAISAAAVLVCAAVLITYAPSAQTELLLDSDTIADKILKNQHFHKASQEEREKILKGILSKGPAGALAKKMAHAVSDKHETYRQRIDAMKKLLDMHTDALKEGKAKEKGPSSAGLHKASRGRSLIKAQDETSKKALEDGVKMLTKTKSGSVRRLRLSAKDAKIKAESEKTAADPTKLNVWMKKQVQKTAEALSKSKSAVSAAASSATRKAAAAGPQHAPARKLSHYQRMVVWAEAHGLPKRLADNPKDRSKVKDIIARMKADAEVENIRKQFAHDDAVVGDVIHSADPGAAGAV